MKLFFNRTQLARKLQIAPQTLRAKIMDGTIKPDAELANRADLFEESAVEKYLKANRKLLKSGGKLPKKS